MLKQRVALFLRQAFIVISLIFMHNCAVDFQDLSESSSSNTSSTETSSGGSSTPVAFTTTWDFSTSGDYTVSSATKIAISGNAALQLVDQTHSASADFSSGTHVGTQYTASTLTTGDAGGCDGSSKNCFWSLDESWTPQWASLLGYWKMDNDWTDSSAAGNDGTAVNDATFSTSSKIGTHAGLFDGTSDYVNISATPIHTGTTYTFAGWFYWLGATGSAQYLFQNGDYGSAGYMLRLSDGSGGLGSEINIMNSGITYDALNSSTDLATNEWVHLAITRSGTTHTLYINGSQVEQATSNMNVAAGGVGTRLGQNFNGYIDDAALWSSPLSAGEIRNLYNTLNTKYSGYYTSPVIDTGNSAATWTSSSWITELPFYKELTGSAGDESSTDYASLVGSTGSTSDNDLMSGIVGVWNLNSSSWLDSSGSGYNGTSGGNVVYESNGLFSGGASFDGYNDYITLPANAVLNDLQDTVYSVSAWVKIPSYPPGTGSDNDMSYGIFMKPGNHAGLRVMDTGKAVMDHWVTGGVWRGVGGSTVLTLQKWHHLVGVVDRSNSTTKIYVDGVLDNTSNWATTPAIRDYGSARWYIGIADPGTGGTYRWYMDGVIDEVAAWSRALDDDEVAQLFRRGSNKIRMQLRSCNDSACAGESWSGPDGNIDTFFSELNNCSIITAATGVCNYSGGGRPNLTSPLLSFSDFSSLSVPANQYFQYRLILDSGDDSTSTMPTLSSLTIGPAHYYGDNPTVELATAESFVTLTSFAVTETGTCDHRYQLSNDDGSTYYYYDGASWTAVANVTTHVNTQADVNTNIGTLPVGSGELKWKAILQSDTTENCTIDDVVIGGTQ